MSVLKNHFWEAIFWGSGVALDIQKNILRKIYNQKKVLDFYKDFRSDFEQSDPSKTTPSSEAFERILVRILVKDFYHYYNPKQKSSQKYATVVLRILRTRLRSRDQLKRIRCFWETIFWGSGVALDIQTNILKKIENQKVVPDSSQDFI